MEDDKYFLIRAFQLAKLGRFTTSPNPNVGCVVVKNGRIIGEGFHKKSGESHAEVHALYMAGAEAKGSTVYTTLEPCSHYGRTKPCTEVLIQAGIARLVSTILDPNPKVFGSGFNKLKKAGIEITYGLMKEEAEKLNLGFLKRMRTGIPKISIKLAISVDGRTALSSGRSKWITSKESRRDVQKYRAESDAILSSSSTVLIDNPSLNVRWSSLPKEIRTYYSIDKSKQPIKVIIDSSNRVTPDHKVIRSKGKTWLARCTIDQKQIWPNSVSQLKIPISKTVTGKRQIRLLSLMKELGCRKINSVLVEAGPNLSGSLLQNKLIDEIILYIAPKFLGHDAKPSFLLPNLSKLKIVPRIPRFSIFHVCRVGPDIRLLLKPSKNNSISRVKSK